MKKGHIAVWDWIEEDRAAAALLVDGKLDDLIIDPADDQPSMGAIYRAKAGRAMKGQGGIVLDLGNEQRGYLRGAKGIAQGDMLTVQVTSYAEAAKATPVTPRILFKGIYSIITPGVPGYNIARSIRDDELRDHLTLLANDAMADAPKDFGLIIRSSVTALGETADTFYDDGLLEWISDQLALAKDVVADNTSEPQLLFDPGAHGLSYAAWTKPVPDAQETGDDVFETMGVWDLIEAAKDISTPLPSGGSFTVEPTRALVAVDVNSGSDMSLTAGFKANLETIKLLPRALRIRGLGGQITIDFAPSPKKDRRKLEAALRSAFKQDEVETILVGWTPLGHFELQRKRERYPLDL